MFGRDWAGVEEQIRLVTRIEDLRFSDASIYIVRGVKISDQTLFDLQAIMNVEHRGPARLGVMSNPFRGDGCFIKEVEPRSAAEGAGLKADDQIIEIDGQMVDSFRQLVDVIAEKEPGDNVPIVYLRDGERHSGEAKLSAWVKRPAAIPAQPKP